MKNSVAAPTAPPAAGTHQFVADPLALMAARAVTALVVGALVVAGAAFGSVEADALWPLALLVLAVFPLVYGGVLLYNLPAERRRFYAQEVADGVDHNRDTFIGDPFNNVRVQGQNGDVEEVIIPKPSSSAPSQPIMQGWGVSAADLVAFVFEVETARGLKETAWVGKGVTQFILPSGKAVTQKRLREIQQALAEHGMASKPDGKWRLDWTAQRIAEHLKRGAQ